MPRSLLAALSAVVLAFAACGDDDSDVASEVEPTAEDTADATATEDDTGTDTGSGGDVYGAPGDDDAADDSAGGAAVTTATTDLGEVLVDADGNTLYGFTNDGDGAPTCTDGCADNWPPVFVDSGELPEGLDPSVFSVVEHPSGEHQLVAGDWPLYRYAADGEPGDTTGQGVGGVWFVVDPAGELIRE